MKRLSKMDEKKRNAVIKTIKARLEDKLDQMAEQWTLSILSFLAKPKREHN